MGVPNWARNGGIAYCRWDGGPLEVAKAHLSNWDYFTSPGAAAAMMWTYTDQGLQMLKSAAFNWVWLTWSAGFSYQQEEVQQAILRPFVKKCHESGIHCTAYMSLTNLFVRDIEMHQPKLLECLQRSASGEVVPYAAAVFFDKPLRVLGCLNHPQWQDHLRNRLRSAIEAGFDAAFYDNMGPACYCDRCRADFKAFALRHTGQEMEMPGARTTTSRSFEELAPAVDASEELSHRQLLEAYWTDLLRRTMVELSRYAETLRPDFMVYCNWHVYHHTFGPPELKALSTEDGQKTSYIGPGHKFPFAPGFEVGGYVSNAGVLKRLLAAGEGWRPVRLQNHQPLGPVKSLEATDFVPYTGTDWQRMIAECWVFRAAQEVFVEGNFMTELFCGTERAKEAWEKIGQYNRFQRKHADLWESADRSEAAFAVWCRESHPETDGDFQRTRFLTALSLAGLQFDVVLNQRTNLQQLTQYPMLWLASTEVMEDTELQLLEAYLKQGGRVLATGSFADWSIIARRRTAEAKRQWIDQLSAAGKDRWIFLPDCDDRRIWRREEPIPDPVVQISRAFDIRIDSADGPVVWMAWRCADGRRVVFVLNPDQRQARRDVRITVKSAGNTTGIWHTPDPNADTAEIHPAGGELQCRVNRLDIFGFLEISTG